MYGFAGFWRKENTGYPGDPGILTCMAGIPSRPDGIFPEKLLFSENGAGLILIPPRGQIDPGRELLSAPTATNHSRILMYSGSLFNLQELRRETGGNPAGDADFLLSLYEKYGQDLPEHLNGAFALAIFDRVKKNLFLARDRFGVKELFYHTDATGFAFATKLSALKKLPSFDCSAIRLDSVLDFLSLQYVPFEKTIFSHTFKLLPGHSLLFNAETNSFSIRRWYIPSFQKRKISFPGARAEFRDLLTEAVGIRLRASSGSPPGVLLSGGLDSAVLTALALDNGKGEGRNLPAFTATFDTPAYNESTDACATAEFLNARSGGHLTHKLAKIPPCNFDSLKLLAAFCGEPFADISLLPAYLLACSAKQETAVCLSGEGADELFFGYERYIAMRLFSWMKLFPAEWIWQLIPDQGERTRAGRLRRFLRTASGKTQTERYLTLISHDAEAVLGSLLAQTPPFKPLSSLRSAFPASLPDGAAAAARCDLGAYLPGDILKKAAVCAEASGLELRFPFLDFHVAEFAFSLPDNFKLKNFRRKRILSASFASILPPDIAHRRKRGFGVPAAEWIRGGWKKHIQERLMEGALPESGLFRRETLAKLMAEHLERKADHAPLLFSLLMLALFYETNPAKKNPGNS